MDTTDARVDPSNADQAKSWDGDEGDNWASNADAFDRAVAGYQEPLLAAARLHPIDHVLDIGCGTGQTTRDAARHATKGAVLGIDLSSAMLEVARQRADAEHLRNVQFVQGDAQIYPFEKHGFNAALSRSGAMFFGDPVAGFSNIRSALCSGGRLALLTWRPLADNEWIREFATSFAAARPLPAPPPDAPGPFALSDPDRVHAILGRAGFTDVHLESLSKAMWFGATVAEAEQFILGVSGWMMDGLDDMARASALNTLRRSLQDHQTARGIEYGSATWLITAVAP